MLECIWFNIKQRFSFIYAFIQISSANFYNLTHSYYNSDTYLKVDFLIFERFWFCITFLKTVVELYVIASKLVQLLSSVENVFNVENCWNFFENIAFYPTNYCYDNTLNHLKYAFCFLSMVTIFFSVKPKNYKNNAEYCKYKTSFRREF